MTTSNESIRSNLDLDRLIAELEAGVDELPERALRAAQAHRDLVVPRLIEVLRSATAASRGGDGPSGNSHFFALFLLAEFRVKEALPAILDAVSLPGELPMDLFGDAITERLSSILAALVDSPEVLDELIRNRELNEYVRWEGAQAYLHLVRDGRLTRDEAVGRLCDHLREAISRVDAEGVTGLICELISYAPHEALDEIREAFRRDLVDPSMVSLDDVEESIAEGESRFQKELAYCRSTGIEDTVEELRSWYAFGEPIPPSPVPSKFDDDLDDEDDLEYAEPWESPSTIRNTAARVGRNDPCPCGSGKKFKKCCGVPQ